MEKVKYSDMEYGQRCEVYMRTKEGAYEIKQGVFVGKVGTITCCVAVHIGFMKWSIVDALTGYIAGYGRTKSSAIRKTIRDSSEFINYLIHVGLRAKRAEQLNKHIYGEPNDPTKDGTFASKVEFDPEVKPDGVLH